METSLLTSVETPEAAWVSMIMDRLHTLETLVPDLEKKIKSLEQKPQTAAGFTPVKFEPGFRMRMIVSGGVNDVEQLCHGLPPRIPHVVRGFIAWFQYNDR